MVLSKATKMLAALLLCMALSGVNLQAALAIDEPDIRVVLSDSGNEVQVGGKLTWLADGNSVGESDGVVTVKLSTYGVKAQVGGKMTEGARLTCIPREGNPRFSGKHYRGKLEFYSGQAGGIVVLNVLPLEEYLLGVVPSEMPPGWPLDALKAQAIAARTYAMSRIGVQEDASFDVYSTVADQAYKGLDGEHPGSSKAVRETAGMVLTWQGRPITAYYCSDAGGFTCAGNAPYLQPVPISVPDSPHNEWQIELNESEIAEAVRGTGGSIGKLRKAFTENDAETGHLMKLTLIGDNGSHSFGGRELRRILGYKVMKSTRVNVSASGGAEVTVYPYEASLNPPHEVQPGIGGEDVVEIGYAMEPAADDPAEQGVSDYVTVTVESYERQWVDDGESSEDQKMRYLFATDGELVEKTNKPTEAWLEDGLEVPGSKAIDLSEIDTGAALETLNTSDTSLFMFAERQTRKTEIFNKGGLGGLVISGSGYGHGIGMSQWGAKQLAELGNNHVYILRYFYRGAELTQLYSADAQSLETEPEDLVEVETFYEPFISIEN